MLFSYEYALLDEIDGIVKVRISSYQIVLSRTSFQVMKYCPHALQKFDIL
jgi:hypothetical protein